MIKAILFLANFVVSLSVMANEDPNAEFNTTKNMTNTSDVQWIQVSNVQERCEFESTNRGLGGFGYGVAACTFWGTKNGKDFCVVITGKKVSTAIFGHEMRHCFQGAFHK